MKLAIEADLLEARNALHKYMTKPGSCTQCYGVGWYPTEDAELYCECAAGTKRKEVDQPLTPKSEVSP
jgi:hypothetical protein